MKNAIGGIGTDITHVKDAEIRVQEAESKLRDVVEHSTNLFYSHNTDHHMVCVSAQAEHLFGCNPKDAKKRWTEFIEDASVNRRGFEITEKAIRTGEPQPPYELELRRLDGSKLWVEFNSEPVSISLNRAIACSLLVNEVITNILKHAFIGKNDGTITIELRENDDDVELTISDNGVGLPDDFDPHSTHTLGMQLIITLFQQLGGSYSYDSNGEGTRFHFTFSKTAEEP